MISPLAIVSVTYSSEKIAKQLQTLYSGEVHLFRPEKGGLRELTCQLFKEYRGIVFIMATGIVIRMIAPLIESKYKDPAIVTVDDAKRFAISTLSGHEGGANELTSRVASLLDCIPVVTTASDTNKNIVIGLGCRRGTSKKDIKSLIEKILKEEGIPLSQVRCCASVELKKDEQGLLEACDELELPLYFVSIKEIQRYKFKEVEPSELTQRRFKIPGVCEPAALIIAKRGEIIMNKKSGHGMTIALIKENL